MKRQPHQSHSPIHHTGILCVVLLALAMAPVTTAQARDDLLPELPPVEDLERALEQHLDAGRRQFEESRRAWEEEREQLQRETEQFREEGERVLSDAMERMHRFLEENEEELERGTRAFREALEALSNEFMEHFHAIQRERDGLGELRQPERQVRFLEFKHRNPAEAAAALHDFLDSATIHVLDDGRLLVAATPEEWERIMHLVEQLDRPTPAEDNLLVSVYVVAAGLPWESAPLLPERFDPLRATLTEIGHGAEPRLLGVTQFRTGHDDGFSGRSYLPDTGMEGHHNCEIHVNRIQTGRDGRVRLDGLQFQADIRVGEGSRPIEFSASPEIELGRLALLGATSVQGSSQAIVLVGEAVPAP